MHQEQRGRADDIRDALARFRAPEYVLTPAPQEDAPQNVDDVLAEFRAEDAGPANLEEAVPPPTVAQSGEGIDRHLENVLSTMNAMSDRSRRLYPAEMSAAVQNMQAQRSATCRW